jgi:3-dehydroquinate synthase class II
MANIQHPNKEEIFAYIWKELAEEREIEVGEHLADCEVCVKLSREIFKTKIFWEGWTAKLHGEIYWQKKIKDSLQVALETTSNPALKARLENWIRTCQAKVRAAVEIVLEEARGMSKVITELPKAIFAPASLQFAYVAAVRGEKTKGEIKVVSKEKEGVWITTDTLNKKIIVQIEDTVKIPPLVILISQENKPLVAQPKKVSGTRFYSVYFENIPAGEYTLIFEPEAKIK